MVLCFVFCCVVVGDWVCWVYVGGVNVIGCYVLGDECVGDVVCMLL